MPTYEDLIADNDFVDSVAYAYDEMGREVPEDRQALVDDFLTYRRAYEDNIINTLTTKGDVDKLSEDGKVLLIMPRHRQTLSQICSPQKVGHLVLKVSSIISSSA